MAVMGRWGSKTFEVSTRKVNPFTGFTTSAESKSDDSVSKKKETELEKVSFSVTCNAAAGVDPEEEYYSWRSLVNAANYLYVHGARWKSGQLKLKRVSIGSTKMDDFGRIRTAELSLDFEEINKKEAVQSSRATASKADKASRK